MLVINHRINSIEMLSAIPSSEGVEIDVSHSKGNIVVGHDPGDDTLLFDNFLQHYRHSLMAVNIKQEGIEHMVLKLLQKYSVEHFFLFDLSFPSLMRLMLQGESRLALRISDIETVRQISFFKGKIEWLWLDTFFEDGAWLSETLPQYDSFKKCFVSPELHPSRDYKIQELLIQQVLPIMSKFDAVCTKHSQRWRL